MIQFNLDNQKIFSVLSGDYNPVHLNQAIARRELFGDIVAHGVNVFLKGFDLILSEYQQIKPSIIKCISCSFHNPAYLSEEFHPVIIEKTNNSINFEIRNHSQKLILQSKVEWKNKTTFFSINLRKKINAQEKPNYSESIDSIKSLDTFDVELFADAQIYKTEYPNLLNIFSIIQIAEIVCYSRIIGMRCPGYYSMFSGFEIKLNDNINSSPIIKATVKQVLPRFSMVNLNIVGISLNGTLKSFFRPKPQNQVNYLELTKQVAPTEFSNQKAIIIGGSRGIGETTAKILLAGGANVTITYFNGKEDAIRIKNEILKLQPHNYDLNIMHLNVLDISDDFNLDEFTHVYYFATPKIFVKANTGYIHKLFETFYSYYVNAFEKLINRYTKSSTTLKVFYPSTTAIDEDIGDLLEYSMAKIAGEILCNYLNKQPQFKIIMSRLPRTATDQTLTLTGYPAENAIDIMLPILRKISN